MPDEPKQENQPETQEPQSSQAAPSTTPGDVPAPQAAPEYRFPDSYPDWVRGKTAGELFTITQSLVDAMEHGTSPQQQPAPAPQQSQTAPVQQGDEDYVTGASLKAIQQAQEAQWSQRAQFIAEQQASLAYNTVKREQADIFKRYEPEIQVVLSRVPRANWTLDVLNNAVKFVKGNHVDELAAEKARQLAATMGTTVRSTGSGTSPSVPSDKLSLDSDKLPERWRSRAKQVGITERELQEFCWINETTPEEFFKLFDKGAAFSDAVAEVKVR